MTTPPPKDPLWEIFLDFYTYDTEEEHISVPVGRAKQQILTHYISYDEVERLMNDIGDEAMPRIGKSGKYIKSPQSFQDGFEEARTELKAALKKKRES